MRVIAGSAKGKRLQVVPGNSTRPIMDRVKLALFNILYPYIENSDFLDLFAGTGGVGIEALSRGAKKSYFIELDKKAYNIVKENVEHTDFIKDSDIRNCDAFSFIKNTSKTFDIIYIDPPQFKSMAEEILQIISDKPSILNKDSIIILKIHPKEYEEIQSTSLEEYDQRKYGNSLLVFYRLKNA